MAVEEEIAMIRQDIVALLSLDPHHWFAQILGQRLADLYEQL